MGTVHGVTVVVVVFLRSTATVLFFRSYCCFVSFSEQFQRDVALLFRIIYIYMARIIYVLFEEKWK